MERADLFKWWDALDEMGKTEDAEKTLQLARESRHPDALWLASLFPPDVAVTKQHMAEVMLRHGDDPRAMHLAWLASDPSNYSLVRRAAEMGYAPAQAQLASSFDSDYDDDAAYTWAKQAAEQQNRRGVYWLAWCYVRGTGCEEDRETAEELFRLSAECEYPLAQFHLGRFSYGDLDWERYYWWGRAEHRAFNGDFFRRSIYELAPLFERGEHGRILHTVGPVIRKHLDVAERTLFTVTESEEHIQQCQRVLELYDAMLGRARAAIDCWTLVGLRCGVVKDIRIVTAKMAWEQAWLWGERRELPIS
jgi:hypothetical protein